MLWTGVEAISQAETRHDVEGCLTYSGKALGTDLVKPYGYGRTINIPLTEEMVGKYIWCCLYPLYKCG